MAQFDPKKFVAEFALPRDWPGQLPGYRMVQVFENEVYESSLFKKGKWGGRKQLQSRGWEHFTTQTGDRHIPEEWIIPVAPSASGAEADDPGEVEGRQKEDPEHTEAIEAEIQEAPQEEIESDAKESADETDANPKFGGDEDDLSLEEKTADITKWDPPCIEGFEWVTKWRLNKVYLAIGAEGWIYADSMKQLTEHYSERISRRVETRGSKARRRLWYRIMRRVGMDSRAPLPFIFPLRLAVFFDRKVSTDGTFVMKVYENQRWSPFLLSWGSKFPGISHKRF
jgi:hypothetical protein